MSPRNACLSEPSATPNGVSDPLVNPSASGRPWRRLLPRGLLLAAVVLGIYAPVINPWQPADLLSDDFPLLADNLTVQHRLSSNPFDPPAHLATLIKLWSDPDGLDYFPLTQTVLWAQWPFFSTPNGPSGVPADPASSANQTRVAWSPGYHATNVLLHLAGAFSLWWLLSVMRTPGAFLGASLFAVHPVCVESVAWVSELKNTLSLPLFLLAAADYVRSDDLRGVSSAAESPEERRRFPSAYVRSIVLFLLAMLAKTSVVAFPLVLLLHAWWKRKTISCHDLKRAAPFFAISFALGLITLWFQTVRAIGDEKIEIGGPFSRLATAGIAILWYLRLIVWPHPLLPSYPMWEVDPPRAWQFLPWALIAAAAWWCWRHRNGWGRHALLGLGFFIMMVAPVLGFVKMSYMRISWTADHFIYAPLVGIAGLVAAGIAVLYDRSGPRTRPLIVAGTVVLIGTFACLSFRYAELWANADRLWAHTLRHNERAWTAHLGLGLAKLKRNDLDDVEPAERIEDFGALTQLKRATALRPDLAENHSGLGIVYAMKAEQASNRGDPLEAEQLLGRGIDELTLSCRLAPNNPSNWRNLVKSLWQAGRIGDVANCLPTLLRLEPDDPVLWNEYGVALAHLGRMEEAIVQFRRALQIAPGFADAKRNLGKASALRAGAIATPQRPTAGAGSAVTRPATEEPPPRAAPAERSSDR
jgi:hypothetical protein